MYKKIFAKGRGNNKHTIDLWTDDGYEEISCEN